MSKAELDAQPSSQVYGQLTAQLKLQFIPPNIKQKLTLLTKEMEIILVPRFLSLICSMIWGKIAMLVWGR